MAEEAGGVGGETGGDDLPEIDSDVLTFEGMPVIVQNFKITGTAGVVSPKEQFGLAALPRHTRVKGTWSGTVTKITFEGLKGTNGQMRTHHIKVGEMDTVAITDVLSEIGG